MVEVGFKATAYKNTELGCFSNIVTLAGTADWATAGPKVKVVKEGDFTDHAKSDGYKVTLVHKFSAEVVSTKAWGFFMEGPVAKSAVIGFWQVTGTKVLTAIPAIGAWGPEKFVSTKLVAPTTALTIANAGLDLKGSGSTTAQLTLAEAKKLGAINGTLTFMWYQPKQIATGIYPTLPRFSKKDKVKTYAADQASADKGQACNAGIELTGASALVAGAAVAFGASALAF